VPVSLVLPGRFNTANAVMAAVAASAFGVPVDVSLDAMAAVAGVAGRFTVQRVRGTPTRLLLAKNPAGWAELLQLVRHGTGPVVVAINARVADGRDPSWLWDVPFEQLAGRVVVASGERSRDLSVRLRYAGVSHEVVDDPVAAVAAAAWAMADGRADRATADVDRSSWDGTVELIGNYTAFHDVLRRPAR
jgi:UDP-N-acetylmuramyl tripeptide synthase